MNEVKSQQKVPWTPGEGFDLSFLTIKRVAQASKSSPHTVKDNVAILLKALPIEERVPVLAHMLESKERKPKKTTE